MSGAPGAREVRLVEEGVEILDQRTLPDPGTWVLARSVDEVATALRRTVTRGAGTHLATLAGMRLTARHHSGSSAGRATGALRLAGHVLTTARPGDTAVRDAVTTVLHDVDAAAPADGRAVAEAVGLAAGRIAQDHDERSRRLAEHTSALLPDGARLLARPSTDADLLALVRAAAEQDRTYRWVVAEARPHLDGARHTAHALRELDQDVTLITDSSVATVLHPRSRLGTIDALITTPHRVTLDGHVVDGVGTLGAAIAARAFDVPVHALVLAPDRHAPTFADVADLVETEQDGDDVLSVLGTRTASPLVQRGHQPALDVVPPEWIDTVVTDRGPFLPHLVGAYWP